MNFIPNSFQLPNAIIDSGIITELSANALKCYLVIVRKTAGWHKEWDAIPTAQLMELTGIKKRQTVYSCLAQLEELELITSVKAKGITSKYSLKVVPEKATSREETAPSEEPKPAKPKPAAPDLPEWLDKTVWNTWVTHRKEIRKALTPTSIKQQLKLLEENKHCHVEIIEASIQNGWTGLFKLNKAATSSYKSKEPEVGSIAWMAAQQAQAADTVEVEVA